MRGRMMFRLAVAVMVSMALLAVPSIASAAQNADIREASSGVSASTAPNSTDEEYEGTR